MYIHGELERHGFKLTEIFAFGKPNCRVKYEFKNDQVHATLTRFFNGKVVFCYSTPTTPEQVEYISQHVTDEVDLIHHIRDFLKEHA